MKVRSGFVSNSSSSSFLIVSNSTNIDEKSDLLHIDMEGSEGRVIFKPTKEMLDYLKQNPEIVENKDISFIKVYVMAEDGNSTYAKDLKDVPDNCCVEGATLDQNSPRTLDELKEWYLNEEE